MHVWLVALAAETRAEAVEMLAPSERDRAARFATDTARNNFIQRRCALREILAGYLGIEPRDLAFSTNAFGKPSLIAPSAGATLSFNASHSGTIAAIAVATSGRIGIDVEQLRPLVDAEQIAARFFAAGESATLAALRPRDRVEGFFNAWTRKEAVVKALGAGLSIPLDAFEVSLRPSEPPAILRWDIAGEDASGWRLRHFDAVADHVVALAVDFDATACHCRRWPIPISPATS